MFAKFAQLLFFLNFFYTCMQQPEQGFIVVFGGCDSPGGNERNKTNDLVTFYCTSVTNATYIFNPFKNTFQRMADAPHPRYRHVAAVFNGELYVLGGRDLADNLVTAIDVSFFHILLCKTSLESYYSVSTLLQYFLCTLMFFFSSFQVF